MTTLKSASCVCCVSAIHLYLWSYVCNHAIIQTSLNSIKKTIISQYHLGICVYVNTSMYIYVVSSVHEKRNFPTKDKKDKVMTHESLHLTAKICQFLLQNV